MTDWLRTEGFALLATVVVVFPMTTWVMAADVLAFRFVSPAKTAVTEWDPLVRALVLNVAEPVLSVPVPSVAAPSLKVIVPVGVGDPETGVTVAVKVTL